MGGGEEGGEEEEEEGEGEGGEHDFGDVDNKYAFGRESIDRSLVVVMMVLWSSLRRDGGGGRGICMYVFAWSRYIGFLGSTEDILSLDTG